MNDFLTSLWTILLELAPWLLLGAAVAGLLHRLLPAGLLGRQLSGRGGVLKAVAFGVPLPLCSCGVIPVGLGLKRQGASDGAAVGFLISTPQTGVDSILVSASMLGWPFALFKVAAAAITGVLGGWIADSAANDPLAPTAEQDDGHSHAQPRTWRGAFDVAVDLVRSIWRWLVIGVLASAAITALLPDGALAGMADFGGPIVGPLAAMAAALVVSLPLYVCATASVPIAAALVAGGLPTGAALVFLMAGPATNVATIGAIYRTLGARSLGVYLTTIVAGSVLAGLGYELLIGPLVSDLAALHTHDHGAPWWAVASSVLLLAMIAWFAIEDLSRLLRSKQAPAASGAAATQTLVVEGMTCQNCVRHAERALSDDPEVGAAHVTLDPPRAVVTGAITAERAGELLAAAGYRATPE
ncbi:putative permease [Pseudobythopirellula maris]|uniref:Putative permease n=1 Tax=Pseudobythopirellula maris TaxID=2527991 RepID=A0A5C5ZFI5_9BACT|nr:permease [Pseudobythopirellula maris]TWT86144.1 putative permease [Pseudobythopirellula maris]